MRKPQIRCANGPVWHYSKPVLIESINKYWQEKGGNELSQLHFLSTLIIQHLQKYDNSRVYEANGVLICIKLKSEMYSLSLNMFCFLFRIILVDKWVDEVCGDKTMSAFN